MISRGIGVYKFVLVGLVLEVKFSCESLAKNKILNSLTLSLRLDLNDFNLFDPSFRIAKRFRSKIFPHHSAIPRVLCYNFLTIKSF